MLAAGSEELAYGEPAILRELLPDGEVDPSFGNDGVVRLPLPEGRETMERADSMILLPGGKVLLAGAGQYWTGAYPSEHSVRFLWLSRLQGNGALDPTFGSDGFEYVEGHGEVNGAPLGVPVLLEEPSGGLILAGSGPPSEPSTEAYEQMHAWAFSPEGKPDQSFGHGGSTIIPVLGGPGAGTVTGAALDPQGRILIAGTQFPHDGEGVPVLARLTQAGALDTSYGTGGFAIGPEHSVFSAVTVDSAGRAIVAGQHRISAANPYLEREDAFVERFLGGEPGQPVPGQVAPVAVADSGTPLVRGSSGTAGTRAVRCVVPKLEGRTLARARRLLSAAHCRLGHITRPRGRLHGRLIVRGQSPARGRRLARGADVNVQLHALGGPAS
jgi:uncharacterized delta-60 repeat protein